jgi:hypothetical protein
MRCGVCSTRRGSSTGGEGIGAPQWPQKPHGAPIHKPPDVLAADEGDVLSKTLAVGLDQPVAVARLLGLHLAKHLRRRGVGLLESLGEIGVDPAILLLEGHCQRENLLLGELSEFSGHPPLASPVASMHPIGDPDEPLVIGGLLRSLDNRI